MKLITAVKRMTMSKIFAICLLLLLASCLNSSRNTSETELLNQRITRLEQRIDSLMSRGNTNSTGSNIRYNDNSGSYGTIRQTNRCQAITKKGTQCKRAAKNHGYCWQHEK